MKQIKIRYSLKYSFPVLLLFSFLLITACQDTDDMEDAISVIKERTFTLTASMPADDTPSGPSTRLIASQEAGSKNIVLKWREGDKIQLYFKSEGGDFVRTETEVKNISTDGRDAEFDVLVPDEVTGDFDLYGVHGAESEASDKTILLDARPSNLDQLGNISIPIYFKKENLSSGSTDTKVSFKHYGSLQVLTFKNTANKRIALEAPYIKPNDDKKWYYDVIDDKLPVYDIVSGKVSMEAVDFSSVASVSSAQISYSDNLQLAQWIVPNEVAPPAVNLSMDIDRVNKTTTEGKEARSGALEVGKAYHLYAEWNGATLDFADEAAVQTYKMTMTTSKEIGSTISFTIDTPLEADKGDIWIDLNNDGQKNEGEAVTAFNAYTAYEFTSPTITIYGKVTVLTCGWNSLTSLDVTNNTALSILTCSTNSLTSLDITKNTALINLNCGDNPLTFLDVTKNTELIYLHCFSNTLTSLDVTNNTKLTYLACSTNSLQSLDVTKNIKLSQLDCTNNQLPSLDVTENTNLVVLYCSSNSLKSLNVTKNTKLKILYCNNNPLESLDVTKNTALTELYCFYNTLESLDVTQNTALKELRCYYNSLESLDVSKCTALNKLHCYYNELTALDVSKCTALNELSCQYNMLKALRVRNTELDVSNTALNVLHCYNNELTTLDVSKCTALNELSCQYNMLKALDVSNTALKELRCYFNVISGSAMDALISGLPTWPESSKGTIYVFSPGYAEEENVCTKAQVATVNGKGWDVKTIFGAAYPGSE